MRVSWSDTMPGSDVELVSVCRASYQCTKMGCTETKGELRQGAPVVTVETVRVLYALRKLSDRDSGPYPVGMHLGADSDSPMWR